MKPTLVEAEDIADWASASELIDGVLFVPPDAEWPESPVCAVAVARGFRGYGKGRTQSEALISAAGEAVERWAAAQVDHAKLIRASYRELEAAFDPRWLCLYGPEQYAFAGFPYKAFDEDRPLHWIEGHWIDNGEPVYLPAFAVLLSKVFTPDALCQMSSNGLAAGSSVTDASERAALELYERDAFMTSWIALQGAELVDESNGREIYLIGAAGRVFVSACVGLGEGITLGLGAARTRDAAIEKAILEHGQTAPYLTSRWREKPVVQILTLEDSALYYCDPAHRAEFDHWRHAGRTAMSVANRDAGFIRIAIADLTPPELKSSPFRVVRALGRGLQPIEYGAAFKRLPTPRLAHLLKDREPNPAPPPIC